MDKITQALGAAGYDSLPTVENLTECFLDYVDAGVWSNLSDIDDVRQEIQDGDITVLDMCNALIKL